MRSTVAVLLVFLVSAAPCHAAATQDDQPSRNKVSVAFIYADFVEAAGGAAPFWHDWGFQKAVKLLKRAFEVQWFNVADARRERLLVENLRGNQRPDVVWSKGCWNGHSHQFVMQARAAGIITDRTPTVIFPACSRYRHASLRFLRCRVQSRTLMRPQSAFRAIARSELHLHHIRQALGWTGSLNRCTPLLRPRIWR
jgi:hypothetical protein